MSALKYSPIILNLPVTGIFSHTNKNTMSIYYENSVIEQRRRWCDIILLLCNTVVFVFFYFVWWRYSIDHAGYVLKN